MVQVFDDWRDEGERVVPKNISGPTADGYFEFGGRVYHQEPLAPEQEKALQAHVDSIIQLGRRQS